MAPNEKSISMEQEAPSTTEAEETHDRRMTVIGLSALGMAAIEAVCSFLILVNGVATILGLGAITVAGGIVALHAESIRYPLLALATLGAMLNLFGQFNAMRLRNDPAAAWRKRSLTKKQKRRDTLVFTMSIVTLLLVASELLAHWHLHGHV